MADRIMDICSRSGLKVSRASIEGIIRNNFPDIRGAVLRDQVEKAKKGENDTIDKLVRMKQIAQSMKKSSGR